MINADTELPQGGLAIRIGAACLRAGDEAATNHAHLVAAQSRARVGGVDVVEQHRNVILGRDAGVGPAIVDEVG